MSVCAPTVTSSQIFKCPMTPDKPPILKFLPITVDPAIAHEAAIAEFLPIITLCAIWIWLSNLTPSCISVSEIAPRSIEQHAPISTFEPIINPPICSIFI